MSHIVEAEPAALLAERYEALIRVSQAISAHREMKEVFRVMSTELRRVISFDGMVVIHTVPGSDRLIWHFAETNRHTANERTHDDDNGIARWVIERQEPVVISRMDEEHRFPGMTADLLSHGLNSLCALPLSTVHRRIGILGFASQERDAFDHEDLRFLSLVADQTAVAIDDALNFENLSEAQARLKANSERLQLLLQINNAVVSNLQLKDIFLAVSAGTRAAMECDVVGLSLPDPKTGELRGYAIDFPDAVHLIDEQKALPRGMVDDFRSGNPRTFSADSGELQDRLTTSLGLKWICNFPVESRGRVLGLLSAGRRAAKEFTPADLELLGQISAQVAIAVENALAYAEIAELKEQLARRNVYLEGEIRSELNFEEIVGRSEALARVLRDVETVAPTDSTVLIYGDTGTGKELIARALHNLSSRAKKSFVKLNCAAIPTGLLESELFGHEKGAFTGAVAERIGRFELANGGTFFLDEIGEIPLELQSKLLRVLQEQEFERLGSSRTLKSNVRLIAATNRDLSAMVSERTFRADLFYRLSVFPIYVPPLRERKEDIPLLVRHFVQHFARRMNRTIDTIPSDAMEVLVGYHWPGNIRELQNLMERAVILSSGPVLKVSLQDLQLQSGPKQGSQKLETMEEIERQHIMQALESCNWVIAGAKGAAQLLGLKRSTLQGRMEKLGIRRP